jgi:hypothetical protein
MISVNVRDIHSIKKKIGNMFFVNMLNKTKREPAKIEMHRPPTTIDKYLRLFLTIKTMNISGM